MRPQGLVPGVQDPGAPDLPAKVLLPALPQRLARSGEEERQQGPCVDQDERVEFVGEGKDQVKRGHGKQRSFAVLQPLGLGEGLTRGAVAIAARVLRVPLAPAVWTPLGVSTALGGTAGHKIVEDLLMGRRHGRHRTVRLSIQAADVRHFPPWGALTNSPSRRMAVGGNGGQDITPS